MRFGCKKLLMLCLLIFLGAGGFFLLAAPFKISGDCMEPAIADGKRYFVNRITPHFRDPQRGDIITFEHEGKIWISRVVALENDVIQLHDGYFTVNGEVVRDNVTRDWQGWNSGTFALRGPFSIPKGQLFVLSDNLAAQHDDSRVFGSIAHSSIHGFVW